MKLHPIKTELGWELADETNTIEPGDVYSSKKSALAALHGMENESRMSEHYASRQAGDY